MPPGIASSKRAKTALGKVGKKTRHRTRASQRSRELVIITGMSGSGKASVLKAFEDLGYYCVDNLPVELIPSFAELAVQSDEIRRTALVVDVREGSKLERLPGILKAVRRKLCSWKRRTQCCCAASARRGGRIRWARKRASSPR